MIDEIYSMFAGLISGTSGSGNGDCYKSYNIVSFSAATS